MKKLSFFTFFLLLSITIWSQRLSTPTLSPFTQIKQEIGLTEITLEYARPSAKGRTVFGQLVPYDKIWRTGANASTKVSFDEAIRIGGKPVMAGTYAIYSIPGEDVWTIIIHSNTGHRSIAGDTYKQEEDVFRFQSKAMHSDDYVESFTLQFSDLTSSTCNIRLTWANTAVLIPIEVEVDAKIIAQMDEYLQNPESIPHRTYFAAAQYFLHNEKDLDKAVTWIDSALEKSPENFRYGLLKSKILASAGDRKNALIVINQAHTWAMKAKNSNYIEQTDIYRKELLQNN